MVSRSLFWLAAFSCCQHATAQCPQTSPSVPIPGCWGEPGCAYVIAANLGPGAACPYGHYNCGGIAVPLLPTTNLGTATIGCGAYTTVPTVQSCPTTQLTVTNSSLIGGLSSNLPSPNISSTVAIGIPEPSNPNSSGLSPPSNPISPSLLPIVATPNLSGSGGDVGGEPPYTPNNNGLSPPSSSITTSSSPPVFATPNPSGSGSNVEGGGSPTNPTTISNGNNSSREGGVGALTNPVTRGGTVSTVSSAFDSAAPSVTSFSYSGGVLTYTKATFTGLTTLQDSSTVSTSVTKTGSDGSQATYVGPIVVGAGGIFWGPPGSAPDCIWPFCLSSGSSSTNGGGSSGGGGGGGGGDRGFGCGARSINGGTSQGGGGGGGNKDGGKDSGEGSNGQPAPEACLGAGSKSRRSSITSIDGRIVKRTEEIRISNTPLKTALNLFGTDSAGIGLASRALDSAKEILTNKFPDGRKNAYVTGLSGLYTLPQRFTVGTGDNKRTYRRGHDLFWRVRWDYDPEKGPHVNAEFGKRPPAKFAFKLDPSQFDESLPDQINWPKKTMDNIVNDLNNQVQYSRADNDGKDQPTFSQGRPQALEDLKIYFKSVAEGPDT